MSAEFEGWLASPWAYLFVFAFGAVWGSFFNVCIARVPLGKSVVRPGSHCFSCGHGVRAFDNIPIVSYLVLRGRCRCCGARFSLRYALVEALAGLLAVAVFAQFVAGVVAIEPGVRAARFFVYFAFAGLLLVLSFIDLDTKRLPDVLTLPGVVVFYLAGFGVHDADAKARALGAAAGYLTVRVISDGYYYLRKREGLGLGDGKLLAVIGALLGWRALLPVVFASSFLGVIVSLPLLLWARRKGDSPEDTEARLRYAQVPFGPFLSASAVVYMLFAQPIWATVVALLEGGG